MTTKEYNPVSGWYRIQANDGEVLIRFFRDGNSYLCDPKQVIYTTCVGFSDQQICLKIITRGPVTQYLNKSHFQKPALIHQVD